jgi:hypothetical protein
MRMQHSTMALKMTWLVFSYSLESQPKSSVRVGFWRRLQQLGTLSLKNGLHVLPDREECLESFQWLAQEVQEAKGEVTIMRVDRFESMTDAQLIELFHAGCRKKYEQLDRQMAVLWKRLQATPKKKDATAIGRMFTKLQRQWGDITRVDFFDSPYGGQVTVRLRRLRQAFAPEQPSIPKLPPAAMADYRERTWVTRPRPHVDRLACAWFIRRFINPKIIIRYSTNPERDEVRFDMRGADFGHHGNLCTFETMVLRFGLSDPALLAMGEIVHEIDIRDGVYMRPETSGIDVILKGWLLEKLSDQELERHGLVLFQGLYASLSRQVGTGDTKT